MAAQFRINLSLFCLLLADCLQDQHVLAVAAPSSAAPAAPAAPTAPTAHAALAVAITAAPHCLQWPLRYAASVTPSAIVPAAGSVPPKDGEWPKRETNSSLPAAQGGRLCVLSQCGDRGTRLDEREFHTSPVPPVLAHPCCSPSTGRRLASSVQGAAPEPGIKGGGEARWKAEGLTRKKLDAKVGPGEPLPAAGSYGVIPPAGALAEPPP